MRLLEHTLSSDVSIHLGGLVVEGIPASDVINRAVPLGAARANTKHLQLYSLCSEIEKLCNHFTVLQSHLCSAPHSRIRPPLCPCNIVHKGHGDDVPP